MKKYRFIHFLMKFFVITLFVFVSFTLYGQWRNYKASKGLLLGLNVPTEEEYLAALKEKPSDIDGMSKYDKYKMGLSVEDSSDTDGDGLTDQEELQLYGSDPLKMSTAGDFYTDGFKVSHGMDLHTFAEYDKEPVFERNSCPEVILDPQNAEDLCAVVEDITGSELLPGYQIIRQYRMYYYGSTVKILLDEVLHGTDLTTKDVMVLIQRESESAKKCKTVTESDTIISLDYDFDFDMDYSIFLVKKRRFQT